MSNHFIFQAVETLCHVLERVLKSGGGFHVFLAHDNAQVVGLLPHGFDVFRGGIQKGAHLGGALSEKLLGQTCALSFILDARQGGDCLIPQLLPAHFLRVFGGNAEGLESVGAILRGGGQLHHGIFQRVHAGPAVLCYKVPFLIGGRRNTHLLGHLVYIVAVFGGSFRRIIKGRR